MSWLASRERNGLFPTPVSIEGFVSSSTLPTAKLGRAVFCGPPTAGPIPWRLPDFLASFWIRTSHFPDVTPAVSGFSPHVLQCRHSCLPGAQPPAPSRVSPDPGCLPKRSVCPRHVAVPRRARPALGGELAACHPPAPTLASLPRHATASAVSHRNPDPGTRRPSSGGPFPCQGSLLCPTS